MARTEKAIKNTVVGIVGMVLSLIVTFLSKSVFIKLLGVEYNGVNSLFTGILSALNLAELGFATSIAYALYKPLNDGDEELISALMNYFKKIYIIVAMVVAMLGLLCVPFLQDLIKEDISTLPFELTNLRIYYVLFLANTVFSYLLAYKRTLLTADQNAYIVNTVDYASNILLNIVQIIALLITKNYYVFLAVMIAKTILTNIIIQIIADKRYPFVKKYKNAVLDKPSKVDIFNNVKAMFLHRVGGVVVVNTVTIVISAIVGIKENGMYGNYLMIMANVNALFDIMFNSVTASVGNLCVDCDEKYQYNIFKKLNYLGLWIGYFCLICYICLFNPFIDLWLGEEFLFSLPIVIVISLNSVVTYYTKSLYTFRDAKGLFRKDWFEPIIKSILAVIMGILMGRAWGVFGVMLGYTIAKIIVPFPIEFYVLFKKGFNGISPLKTALSDLAIFILSGLVCALTYYINSFLPLNLWAFIVRIIICLILPNILFVLFTMKTDEYKYYKNLAIRICKGIKGKIFKKKPVKLATNNDNTDNITKENNADIEENINCQNKENNDSNN